MSLLAHGPNESRDLFAPPVGKALSLLAGQHFVGPIDNLYFNGFLESFPAAGAEARVLVRIPDVIKMDAVHVVIAHDFEHRIAFEREVFRMGWAKPVHVFAFSALLRASRSAQFFEKLLR